MLTLYVKSGCVYCLRVLGAGFSLGIEFDERNIADPANATELKARGGELQVPYLVDTDSGTELYESEAIIQYLHEKFGTTT